MNRQKWIGKLAVTTVILLLALVTLSAQAQQGEYHESFDDPALPGWERSPGAAAIGGILRVEPGNFAFRPGGWGEAEIHVQMKVDGEGEAFFTYQMADGNGYQIVFGTTYMLAFRLFDGGSTVLGSTEPLPAPLGEWLHLIVLDTGGNHTVLVNDEVIFQFQEIELLPPGGVSFEAHGGMNLEVDELSVFPLGEGSPPGEEPPSEEEPPGAASTPEPALLSSEELTWVRTGGPLGGIGYDIRYKFDQTTTWYVTDNFAGVHVSTDDGLTWQPSNEGISGQLGPSGDWKPVFSLTIDPHDPDTIWAGTDKTGHIYKSTDAGKTWIQKDHGVAQVTQVYDALTFRGFTVDPRSSDIVYAMAEIENQARGGAEVWSTAVGGQVYKTSDGGENWTLIWDGGIPSSLARYLWVNPEDTNILYVSTGIFDRGAVNEGAETDPNPYGGLGILKSTDGGKTWRILNEANGLNHLYVSSLFMHPDDPDILLAATGKGTSEQFQEYLKENNLTDPMGVYRTTDGGETWTQVLVGGMNSVEICTVDTDIAYTGNELSIYRSEDSGITWTKVTGTPEHGWGPPGVRAGVPIDFQCDPEDPNRLFSNNYVGGNFVSEDGGKTWVMATDGYTGAQTISVQVDPTNPAQIVASGRNGIWGSHDGGSHWYGMRYPPEGVAVWAGEWGGVAIDPGNPQHLLAVEETIWESYDGGNSWEVRKLPGFGLGSVIMFAPSNNSTVYTGGLNPLCVLYAGLSCNPVSGLYVSHDGGTTWSLANDENIATLAIIDIAVDLQDENTVYIATMEGLYKTTDGGKNWQLNDGLPTGERVSVITLHPENDNLLFAGVECKGLYVSRDGGGTWQQVAVGLPPNAVLRDLIFDPVNSQNLYLTDLTSGVYRSTDGGSTWMQINNGLSNRAAIGLGISSDGLHLYTATNGEGVFRMDLNGQPPVSTTASETSGPAKQPDEGNPEEGKPPEEIAPDEQPNQLSVPHLSLSAILLIVGGLILLAAVVLIVIFTRRFE